MMPATCDNREVKVQQVQERVMCYKNFSTLFSYPSQDKKERDDGEHSERQIDYLNSFDCSANEKACSLFGSDHCKQDRNSHYEDLLRFYHFYGLKRAEHAEQPDHLCIELQFMIFLLSFELEQELGQENIASLHRAQHEFITRFLLPLNQAVTTKLSANDTIYGVLVRELDDFMRSEAALIAELNNNEINISTE